MEEESSIVRWFLALLGFVVGGAAGMLLAESGGPGQGTLAYAGPALIGALLGALAFYYWKVTRELAVIIVAAPIAYFAVVLTDQNPKVDFGEWIIFTVIVWAVLRVIVWLLFQVLWRKEVEPEHSETPDVD